VAARADRRLRRELTAAGVSTGRAAAVGAADAEGRGRPRRRLAAPMAAVEDGRSTWMPETANLRFGEGQRRAAQGLESWPETCSTARTWPGPVVCSA